MMFVRKVASMGKGTDAHKHSVFKQTDIGLTDPRLMRSVMSRSKDGFHCSDALNNCPTEVITRYRVTNGGSAVKFRGYEQGHGGNSLPGRFARACLPRDARSPDANCNLFQNGCERPNTASRHRVRWSSTFSDGQESCLSAQSELGTPNDDGRVDSVTDSNEVFPSASDSSLSAEEQAEPSLLPLDSMTRSPVFFGDRTARNCHADDGPFCEAVEDSPESAQLVRKTPDDVGGDFDIYSIETTLPYMNWDYLEEQLQKAIEKEETSQSQRNDREKIRQKLAMGLDDDHFVAGDQFFKKPSLQTRLHGAKNLQICFVNEASNDVTESSCNVRQPESKTFKDVCHKELSSSLLFRSLSTSNSLASSRNSMPSATTVSAVAPSEPNSASQDGLDFFTRQARLQAEARLALAQVRPMAYMQLQLEKQMKRKSPIADIVGIPGFGDGKNGRPTRQLLRRMNLGQLQVVVNDMHTQIEAFNTELMELLIERDDLYLAQNSMLVDIEDLTRRAQEYDMRMKSKLVESRNSC